MVARIVVTSDLHLGITRADPIRALAGEIAAEEPDLTVLAGDLGERLPNVVACLEIFRGLPGMVAVLAGNHDVWARDGHTSRALWERELPAAACGAGMLWLEEDTWRHGDLAVAGSLAWYDYSAADPRFLREPPERFAANKGRYNMDARYVDWEWPDVAFAARLGDGLCARLDALDADPEVRGIVVVTHVPLFEEQMARKPLDRAWGYSNAYFGNLALGRRVLAARKLLAVVSGHTHVARSGTARRPGAPGSPPVPVTTLGSDYGRPVYAVLDDAAWSWPGTPPL